jgi:glycosyltransferase involved in cell wall biosynthesis
MNNSNYPLVSIGIPIYNEARFVNDALCSILAQDYPNLEILISDNASSDETLTICRRLIVGRSDVFIHQFETNMGAAENFKYVLQASTGKYFMWASGHDLWDPNYISENVALLETVPTAVVAFGSSAWIDENSCRLPRFFGYTDTRGMTSIA